MKDKEGAYVSVDDRPDGKSPRDDSQMTLASEATAYGPLGARPQDPLGLLEPQHRSDRGRVSAAALRRHWRLIIALTLVLGIPAAAGIWFFVTPKYRAQAAIRVQPIIPFLVFPNEQSGTIPLYQSYVNTQIAVISSPMVLERVLENPAVSQSDWARPHDGLLADMTQMERLKNSLTVQPRPMTEVVDIIVEAEDPQSAALLANTVLDQYMAVLQETGAKANDAIYQALSSEYSQLEQEITSRQQVLDSLQRELGTSDIQTLVASRKTRLDDLEAKLDTLKLEIASAEWQKQELEKAAPPVPEGAQAPVRYSNDPEWRRLWRQVRTIEAQVEREARRWQPDTPVMKDLRDNLALAREELADRQSRLDEGLIATLPTDVAYASATELERTTRRLSAMTYERALSEQNLASQKKAFAQILAKAEDYSRQNQSLNYKREIFNAVRRRLEQKDMERKVPGAISVLTRAFAEHMPVTDRRWILIAMAFMAALGVGVLGAFARSADTDRIQDARDLPLGMRVSLLGELPLGKGGHWQRGAISPALVEPVRMIRTAILGRLSDSQGVVLLVTSAHATSDRSAVSMLLAESLARCGRKVLLVDADFRTATISRMMAATKSRGLIAALSQGAMDEETIVPTTCDRLSLLPTERAGSDHDLEAMANGQLSRRLDQWRRLYDVVLFDSAPILLASDAQILCRKLDATIMVMNQGRCRRSDLFGSLMRLNMSGGKLFGTVLVRPGNGRAS